MTKEQILKAIMVGDYTTILLLKPKNYVFCHRPSTLEYTMDLMEAYASTEAGL